MQSIDNEIPKHISDKKYDVVIIGAGIGGLTAAALLAKCGLEVCVVEMAPHSGGYLVRFERDGFHFDTAIHWLNQCGHDGLVRRIFDLIAPDSPKTIENKRIRRFVNDSYDYILTNTPDEMRDNLISKNKEEEKAIRKFFRASKATATAFSRLAKYARSQETMSMTEKAQLFLKSGKAALPLIRYLPFSAKMGMKHFFRSSGLRQLYSTEDKLLSCMVPVGWAYNNDYQLPPIGGSQAFTEWLVEILKSWDASVFFNSRVNKINVDNGKSSGISFTRQGETHDIQARYVIAACDAESVYLRMLPEGTVNQKIIKKLQNAEVYNSCLTVSLGLNCPTEDLGIFEEQVLIRRDDITKKEQESGDPDKTEISVIASSSRDATVAPKGKGVIMLYTSCTIDYEDFWKTERGSDNEYIRGDAYKAFKKEYADILIKRVEEKLIPALRSHIEVIDIATPVTYLRYTDNRDGAIMGFRPNSKNIRNNVASISTPVENLYIGSQWAGIGGGVPNAVKAGMNSALLIIKKEKPEAFKILADVIDEKLPPEQISNIKL